MKISELTIGDKFRTKITSRGGIIRNILGFSKNTNISERRGSLATITGEEQYVVIFDDGEMKDLHPDVQVEKVGG